MPEASKKRLFKDDVKALMPKGVIPLEELAVLYHKETVRPAKRVILR